MLRVLVVGLGSIGQRHVRVLNEICDLEIIAFRSLQNSSGTLVPNSLKLQEVYTLEDGIRSAPDFALVTNPTALHVSTGFALAQAGIPFFLEKPVSDSMESLERLTALISEKQLPVLVGYQMRHHPGFMKLQEWIRSGKVGRPLYCHIHIGQYLPDWRPGADYRLSYSGSVKMGGGVMLDLSHGIDLALAVMGKAESVQALYGRFSDLQIQTEDCADILLAHEKSSSHIHLDYLERGYEWTVRVSGTDASAEWDYGRGSTSLLKNRTVIDTFSIPLDYSRDDLFRSQMSHFLEVFKGNAVPVVDISQGLEVNRIINHAKLCSVKE